MVWSITGFPLCARVAALMQPAADQMMRDRERMCRKEPIGMLAPVHQGRLGAARTSARPRVPRGRRRYPRWWRVRCIRSSATTGRARAASCNNSRRCSGFPNSSNISRRTASSMVSAASTKPARHEYIPGRNCFCRPSRHLSPWVTSMITTGSVRGKCSALQFGHSRFQPPSFIAGAGSAIGAEAVALMPGHHRFGHRDRRELFVRYHTLHHHTAQLGDGDVVARQQLFHRRCRNAHAEYGSAVAQAQKNRTRISAELHRFLDAEQHARAAFLLLHQQRVAIDDVGAGVAVGFQRV